MNNFTLNFGRTFLILAIFLANFSTAFSQSCNIAVDDIVTPAYNMCECVDVREINLPEETSGFDVFVREDATFKQGDTEGPIAIGGDLIVDASDFQVAAQTAGDYSCAGDANKIGLMIGGTLHTSSSAVLQVGNNGFVKIGNTSGLTIHETDMNGATINTIINRSSSSNTNPKIELRTKQSAASIEDGCMINFSSVFADLEELSDDYANVEDNVCVGGKGTQAVINLTSGQDNFVTIDADDLNSYSSIQFSPSPSSSSPLVITVPNSGSFDFDIPNLTNIQNTDAKYVIWNFPNLTSLELTGSTIIGSILAPNADVDKAASNNIEGQVLANSYIHRQGEVHNKPFSTSFDPVCVDGNRELELSIENVCPKSDMSCVEAITWNTGSCAETIHVSPIETTTYTATITYADGTSCVSEVEINVDDIACTSANIALAIELEDFTVTESDCETLLSWDVNAATNFSHFVVEESLDGERFGTITALAHDEDTWNYSLSKKMNTGVAYYRLKMVDLDGTYEYSRTVAFEGSCAEAEALEVFPNPISSGTELNVRFNVENPADDFNFSVTNVHGQQVLNVYQDQISTGMNTLKVDISGLTPGIYFIRNNSTFAQQFVVTK